MRDTATFGLYAGGMQSVITLWALIAAGYGHYWFSGALVICAIFPAHQNVAHYANEAYEVQLAFMVSLSLTCVVAVGLVAYASWMSVDKVRLWQTYLAPRKLPEPINHPPLSKPNGPLAQTQVDWSLAATQRHQIPS